MIHTIAYTELNNELQELYLKSKNWLSDLEFLEQELKFVDKLFQDSTFKIKGKQNEVISEIIQEANCLQEKELVLKNDVEHHLHQLEPLILNSDLDLDFALLEKHFYLEATLADALKTAQGMKNMICYIAADR